MMNDELKEMYLDYEDDELIEVAQNGEGEYEADAVETAKAILSERGVEVDLVSKGKLQISTIRCHIEEGIRELANVLQACSEEALNEESLLQGMEQAIHLFNGAYNMRYMTNKEVSELPQEVWEKNVLPPKEIFKGSYDHASLEE